MSPFCLHIILHIVLALGSVSFAYTIGGVMWAQNTLIAYLILWLAHHLKNIKALEKHIPAHSIRHHQTLWSQLHYGIKRKHRIIEKHRNLLRQTLIRFQAAAQALPNGIIILNTEDRIEWLNHTALEHFNITPQQALANPLKKMFDNNDYQTLFTNTSQSAEIQISRPQDHGIERHFRIMRIPFSRTQLIISEDISRAEQLNATRTMFIANVSHELRTPLTIINGFLETLHDYPELTPTKRQQFITLMQHESHRMLNIINDLLTLATLENPTQHNIAPTPLNLSELCQQIHEAAQNLSTQNHTITLSQPDHIWINGYPRDLYQALSNLVFNAVRYTPKGGNIDISLHHQANPNPYKRPQIRFIVRDNGVGIAPQHLPHLTDRFYRVDKGRSRDSGGTGLGLAIAKHALAKHHTTLHVRSEIGKGSEFSVVFETIAPPSDPHFSGSISNLEGA